MLASVRKTGRLRSPLHDSRCALSAPETEMAAKHPGKVPWDGSERPGAPESAGHSRRCPFASHLEQAWIPQKKSRNMSQQI